MMKRTKITLVAVTAVVAMAGIGGGIAFAANSGPATSTAAAPSTTAPGTTHGKQGRHGRARAIGGRVEHGRLTMRTKTGDEVVDVQRGQVTAVNATSVTVKSQDGFTATYAVGSAAKIRVKKQTAAMSGVHVGDRVGVTAVHSGSTDTVRRLADAGPAPAK
jgi:hypothetical protein